jgi:16S rRNA (guanine527-N7)-methyltransferase
MLDSLTGEAIRRGVRLSDPQLKQFSRYLALLLEWSPRVNLVGNADPTVIERRHFAESITLGAVLREREILRPESRMLDVGAGAGFPGVPIKICWPSIDLTLLEATAKKAAFLNALVKTLAIEDTHVVNGRAETSAHDDALRERFDLVVARAVAPLPTLLELTLPFARIGGRVVTPKGSRAKDELEASTRALATLGGKAFIVPFDVPGPPQSLLVILKQKPAPPEYPRRAGVPSKSPL